PVPIEKLHALGALPPMDLQTLDGKTITNADLAGKVTILHFWGTHCPPCVAETPALKAAYDSTLAGDPRLTFITLANDQSHHDLERYVSGRGLTWPVIPSTETAVVFWQSIGIDESPATVIVDPQGQIQWAGLHIPSNLPEIVSHLAQ
ncbi:MAG: TlpA disulfide reductase family protein, partial [bacterium]